MALPEFFHLRGRQPVRGAARRNAGAEQGFARVNIADAGDERLVEQFYFDRLARAFQFARKHFRREISVQRFRSEFFNRRQIQSQPAKIARVFVNEICLRRD